MTPLILEVNSNELVEVEIVRVLLLIIEEVATSPLMLVVKTLPKELWVKELIKFTTLEAIPFMTLKKELVDVDILFEFIIVAVPTDPAMLEVKVFNTELNKLLIDKFSTDSWLADNLETVALEMLALFETTLLKAGLLKVVNEVTPFTVEVSLPEELE
jgi:hypothetical protein